MLNPDRICAVLWSGGKSRKGSGNTCCSSVQNVACTQLYNWHCYCHFLWVWNLVSYIKRRTD